MLRYKLAAGFVIFLAMALMSYGSPIFADIPACSQSLKNSLLLSSPGDFANITTGNCKLDFSAGDILKPLRITGQQASGLRLDCNGAKITRKEGAQETTALLIQSSYNPAPLEQQMLTVYESGRGTAVPPYGVSRPENIEINGCRIAGAVTVAGAGGNPVSISSRSQLDADNDQHTRRMQAMAPTNIRLKGLQVYADPSFNLKNLLHLHSGVTNVSIINSTFSGEITDVTLYLSPESAQNLIKDNLFDVKPHHNRKREIIALDGSADNTITGNAFKNLQNGGIHLYRNCGEKGLTRHQPASGNRIFDNDFFYLEDTAEAIWVNKRSVAPVTDNSGFLPTQRQTYCQRDEEPIAITLHNGTTVMLKRSSKKLGSAEDTHKLPLEAGILKITDLSVNHDAGVGNRIYNNYFFNYGQHRLMHDGIAIPTLYKRIDHFKNAVKYTGSDYIDAAIKFSGLNVEAGNFQSGNQIVAYPKENCRAAPAPFTFDGITRRVMYSSEDEQCYILPTVKK